MTKPDLRAIAQAAAEEHAPHAAVGGFIDSQPELDGSQTFTFESRLKGYVGWRWSVNVFEDKKTHAVTISEVLLLPGENALVAPDWVPWSERLADYKALQAELAAQAAAETDEAGDDEDPDDSDDESDDDSFDDESGSASDARTAQHFTEDEVEAEVEAAEALAEDEQEGEIVDADSAPAPDPEPAENPKGKSDSGRGRFQRRRARNQTGKK